VTSKGIDERYAQVLPYAGRSIEQMMNNGSFKNQELRNTVTAALRRLREDIIILNDNGISHNDIIESNIAYNTENGEARLIDFGEAQLFPGKVPKLRLSTGDVVNWDLHSFDDFMQIFARRVGGSARGRRTAGKAKRRTRRLRSIRLAHLPSLS
jgi:serine/threonine protein kinase